MNTSNIIVANELDEAEPIWRYMSLKKFLELITGEYLWFSDADKFQDQWELAPPREMLDENFWFQHLQTVHTNDFQKYTDKEFKTHARVMVNNMKAIWHQRGNYAVSCWHRSEQETEFFWTRYASLEEGVAIRSTVSRLSACFSQAATHIHISPVLYLDFEKNILKQINLQDNWPQYYPALYKRFPFKHEQEVRAVIYKSDKTRNYNRVSIDIKKLIQEVVYSPAMSDSLIESLQYILSQKGFTGINKKSQLYAVPDFEDLPSLLQKNNNPAHIFDGNRLFFVFNSEDDFIDANCAWIETYNPKHGNVLGGLSLKIGTRRLCDFHTHPKGSDKRVIAQFPSPFRASSGDINTVYGIFSQYASQILSLEEVTQSDWLYTQECPFDDGLETFIGKPKSYNEK